MLGTSATVRRLEQPRPFHIVDARAIAIVAVCWLIVGFLSAGQYYLAALTEGDARNLLAQIAREAPPWQVWTPLSVLAFYLAATFPLSGSAWLRALPLHVLAAVTCAMIYLGCWLAWIRVTLPSIAAATPVSEQFWVLFRVRFNVAFLLYWGIIGAYYALSNYRMSQDRALEVAEARAELAQARMRALRSQLQPHFLFNTLHSIAALVDHDPPTARRLIARLSDLLRTVLDTGEVEEVPLRAELDFLDGYLEIERVRLGHRLRVELDIEREAERALVPPLLLQPLVENAIRHGVAPLEEGGTVRVAARRRARRLHLDVENTAGAVGAARGSGVGLSATRARLAQLYGADHGFEWRDGTGTVHASIWIPFRPSGITGTEADDA